MMPLMTSKLYLICAPLMVAFALSSTEATTSANSTTAITSPWLKKKEKPPHGRGQDCWYRPWICREPEWSFIGGRRMMCCMNRCVDVGSDPDNCGLCGARCMLGRQCCSGFCSNVMRNPFHCGNCFNRCPVGSFCLYGLCSYAQPEHPKPPKPPFQPKPPFHPKPPKQEPPFHHKPKPEPPFRRKPLKPEPPFHHKPRKPPKELTPPPPDDQDRTARHLHHP